MVDLNERSANILNEIVDIYSRTGQPVGSKTLAENLPAPLSPATIRNVMAELERKGLLISPHTSSGRIPTESGFRYYAKGLVEISDLDKALRHKLETRFEENADFGSVMQEVSRMLASMTSCAGLVLAPKYDNERLHYVEFVRLGPERALVILVAQSGKVENRMIGVPPQLRDRDLKEAARQINDVVQGLTLAEAQDKIVKTLREQKLALDKAMDSMLLPAQEAENGGDLMVGGSQNLFGYPELVRERLQSLFEVFEEKKLLIGLLDRVRNSEGVQVFVGAECPLEAAQDCAMITSTYSTKDRKIVGTVGVIGPMRLDYKQSIALVDYTAQLLGRALDRHHGTQGDNEESK